MPVNIALYEYFLNQTENSIVSGMNLATYLKACFFIYEEDADTGTIRIDDRSTQISQYNALTDVHEVYVYIRKENCDQCELICYQGPFTPFGNLSYSLPQEGAYTIEIDVRYTIQWDDGLGNIIPYTFQTVLIYPVEWVPSGNYHNMLVNDIKCRIVAMQLGISKRVKVGRDWLDVQHRVYMLNNYLYALCNFGLSSADIDKISNKIKTIKKTC